MNLDPASPDMSPDPEGNPKQDQQQHGSAETARPWPERGVIPRAGDLQRGGAAFADLHRAQRALQDTLTSAALPDNLSADITARLQEITALAAGYQVLEPERRDGMRPDLPGRGQPFMPAYLIDGYDDDILRGRVTFSRFHLGGNGAVHGGSIPLVFDDVFGMVANIRQDGIARTAYLHVNFRKITPIGVELRFEASEDRVEGRKRFVSGRLLNPSGEVCADAEGLFLRLLPGQA